MVTNVFKEPHCRFNAPMERMGFHFFQTEQNVGGRGGLIQGHHWMWAELGVLDRGGAFLHNTAYFLHAQAWNFPL
jgi:hypothetical protein